MERSILFLTLSLVCFYLILDEFVGKKRVSSIIGAMVSGGGGGDSYTPNPRMPIDPDYKEIPEKDRVDPSNPFEKSDIERGRLTSTGINDKLISPTRKSGVFL
jgi:hypothetical protein